VSLFELRVMSTSEVWQPRVEDLSALAGSVFVISDVGMPGYGSLHFEDATTAYLSYEASPGCPGEPKKMFSEVHWHEPTQTFHGLVNWPNQRHEYVLQFSADLQSICGGSIAIHRPSGPLDGQWTVEWENGTRIEITVSGGCWKMVGESCRINLSRSGEASFTWGPPGLETMQRCEINLSSMKAVGDRIQWSADHSDVPIMTWVRTSAWGSARPAPEVAPLGEQYRRLNSVPVF